MRSLKHTVPLFTFACNVCIASHDGPAAKLASNSIITKTPNLAHYMMHECQMHTPS